MNSWADPGDLGKRRQLAGFVGEIPGFVHEPVNKSGPAPEPLVELPAAAPALFVLAALALGLLTRAAFLEPVFLDVPEEFFIVVGALDHGLLPYLALSAAFDGPVALGRAGAERAPEQHDGQNDKDEE